MTSAVMIQGTGSNVGKSLIVAGLARAYTNRGVNVRPFKPQNMSNNAAVAVDGGEIGRAQALQAQACRVKPSVHMNPVLLKPETDKGAQIIVRGQRQATMDARDYLDYRKSLLKQTLESYAQLSEQADLILVEGAGSPAEINLREGDIANMGFAQAARLPVILVGDIHRGGVIASLVGTMEVLKADDRALVKGFLVNNFHGDRAIFSEGASFIGDRTGLRCLGIIPHFSRAHLLPSEDVVDLEETGRKFDCPSDENNQLNIAVPRLNRIANFDDLDPLMHEPNVGVTLVQLGQPIPNNMDLILVPGTKSTIRELEYVRSQGWDIDIVAHVRQGKPIIGLCGGYQILGKTVSDPGAVEGTTGEYDGLGLLNVHTVLSSDKKISEVRAIHCQSQMAINGYQIHLGITRGPDCIRPFAQVNGKFEGAVSENGLVMGTYIHGCFSNDAFRRVFLSRLKHIALNPLSYQSQTEQVLDALAEHLDEYCDLDFLLKLARHAPSMPLVSPT